MSKMEKEKPQGETFVTNDLKLQISNYLAGDCSLLEKNLLLSFLASNAEGAALFQQMSAVRAIASVPAFADEAEANLEQLKKRMQPSTPMNPRKRLPVWMKIAAAVLLLLSFNLGWYLYTDHLTAIYTDQQASYEIKVPAGSRTNIILPDGTDVTLNAGSVLRYSRGFGIRERQVSLSGEGYFKVAKNAKIPFYVHTNGVQVQVVGTMFNVCAYDNERYVTVSLMEGKVNLTLDGNGTCIALAPHDEVIYDRSTRSASK
ncbi:MAG: FecR family protein, partial [Bacteroides sp.]